MKRVLNFGVVAASAFIMANAKVDAAVIDISEGSTSGYTMTDGNTYVIQNSVSFTNNMVGGSGMSVENGATVVLYIPEGVTLTAIGANGSGRTGGGAGIRVPATTTLIITGEGMVIATGGAAGDGENGRNGTKSTLDDFRIWVDTYGVGGSGGNGGGGAGAGIGGIGGIGGLANSGNGGAGESMGSIYVLGSICVEAHCGVGASAGKAGSLGSSDVYFDKWGEYILFGGSGGGGGAGSPPTCSMGGGGSGGGAGGRGKNGVNEDRDSANWPQSGGGGGSLTECGIGGEASTGGSAGSEGEQGALYVDSNVVVDVERSIALATTHPTIQYTITFDAYGGTLSSESNNITARLGCDLPDCIPTPIRRGYLLCGWKDDNGTEYYDGNGEKMLTSYSFPGDVVLHAEWVIDPDRMIIMPADGTIFEGSLTIAMSSSVEGTMIRLPIT